MIDYGAINRDMLYKPLDAQASADGVNDLVGMIEAFMEKSSLKDEDIGWFLPLLIRIVDRVDQRSDYFTYFHSDIDDKGVLHVEKMSQYKQIALLCFWIIKYKPLRITDPEKEWAYYCKNHCTVNEVFAAYIFVSTVCASGFLTKKQRDYYQSPDYLADIFYKFMHHDISKEALIFSLCSLVGCK